MKNPFMFFRKKGDFALIEQKIVEDIKELGFFKGVSDVLAVVKKKALGQLLKNPSGFFILPSASTSKDGLMLEVIFGKANGLIVVKLDHLFIRILNAEEIGQIADSMEFYRKYGSKGKGSYTLDEVLKEPFNGSEAKASF